MALFMSNMGGLSPGKLVATAGGKATAHALASLQDRGKLFISPGEVNYAGVLHRRRANKNMGAYGVGITL